MRPTIFASVLGISLLVGRVAGAAPDGDASSAEFFERKIRPVLADRCYSCHSAKAEKLKGDLLVDTREGLLKGGSQGAAIRPGDPDGSLLLKAIRYTDPDLRMPPKSRLPAEAVRDFEAWIRAGAPDPRTGGPPVSAKAPHWAFRPLGRPAPPDGGSAHPVDAFIDSALRAKNLRPAPPADRATLLRRVTYDLVGLPPAPEEVDAFVADDSPDAFEKIVGRLLASPQYGERWGRHWLDLVRYTDDFEEAWRYRDWVIRAFNDDLPYGRFVRMQIAGDRLPAAAPADGIVATTFLSLGTWGGIDRKKRLLDVVDDQVDTTGRTFLGLTLACARCHDHKFDPISTREYYGLAGIFLSSRIMSDAAYLSHGAHRLRVPLVSPEEVAKHEEHEARVRALQERLDSAVKEAYREFGTRLVDRTADYIEAAWEGRHPAPVAPPPAAGLHDFAIRQWARVLETAAPGKERLLSRPMKDYDGESGVHAWMGAAERPWWGVNTTGRDVPIETFVLPPRSVAMYPSVEGGAVAWTSPISGPIRVSGRLVDLDPLDGVGVGWTIDHESAAGRREVASGSLPNGGASELDVARVDVEPGDRILLGIWLNKDDAHYDATGVRLTIRRAGGAGEWDLTSDLLPEPLAGNPHGAWSFWDLAGTGRSGRMPAVEPLLAAWRKAASGKKSSGEIREAAKEFERAALADGFDGAVARELAGPRGPFRVKDRDDARYLSPEVRARLDGFRRELESLQRQAPPFPCAHGVREGGLSYSLYPGFGDAPVHVRGSYERLGPAVPRGVPKSLGGESFEIREGSGRDELARWVASPDNPLTARVLVNRLWLHHFGEGLVRTPSNFGSRGEPPTHPELLDYLARRFLETGGSIKAMHRLLLSSATYRRASRVPEDLLRADPENRLWGRMNRRRLEAESFHDGLLAIAGTLDPRAGGPAERTSARRRMIYLRRSRSDRSGFATLFDGADPALHVEKRNLSTIAPQALFLMNAPFLLDQARALAARPDVAKCTDADRRIDRLYRLVAGRPPSDEERALGRDFVGAGPAAGAGGLSAWELYAQAILLSNEAMFVD